MIDYNTALGDGKYLTLNRAASSLEKLAKPENYSVVKMNNNSYIVTVNYRAYKFQIQGDGKVLKYSEIYNQEICTLKR